VVTGGGQADVIEAKWTELPQARDARGIRELISSARGQPVPEMSVARGFIACRPAEPFPVPGEGPRVDAVDLARLLAHVGG
jgi:hypothetical protein